MITEKPPRNWDGFFVIFFSTYLSILGSYSIVIGLSGMA